MLKYAYNRAADNRDYQRVFAHSLVQSLGYEGAIDICYRNFWHGTLSCILKDKRH